VQENNDDPARLGVLEELHRSAVATYGEERSAEATLETALRAAATAVWRVSQEPVELSGQMP
jgi:hypothetical protein